MTLKEVWVFRGDNAVFPSAIFSTQSAGEEWIVSNRLSGTLTKYPLDEPVYDWAIRLGYFTPKQDKQKTPEFIGKFSTASQEHFHYKDGVF